VDSLLETLKNIGAGRLALMLFTFFGLIVFFIYIAVRSNEPGMTMLYSNLSTADATEISAKLSVSRIAHKLNKDGTAVMVSQKEVGKARILLAQEGLPHQGTIGYEIFDKKESFGTTSFVQNINQVRALEGELARTIGTIENVRNARVHLVIPQRQLFSREVTPASASVFINLRNNSSIDKGQLQAIQHLVGAAVPMLKSKNVVIIDQSGNLLARGAEDDSDGASSRNGEEMRVKYERKIARSIEDILGRVVGYGRVRAEVTADMNFDVTNINAEIYDPSGQVVRSTQTTTEDSSDNSSSSGGNKTVSVKNNLPGLDSASGDSPSVGGGAFNGSKNNRTEEVTNFEISKKIENTVRATGNINKISVAVLVDGSYVDDDSVKKPKDAAKNWTPPKKYVPRTKKELENIASLVKSSIGFDESRGDILEVINMKFAQEIIIGDLAKDTGTIMGFQKTDLLKVAETVTLSIVAVLIIMLVLKPLAVHIVTTSARAPRHDGATLAEETALLSGGIQRQAQIAAPSGGGGNDAASELENMIDMSSVEGKVKESSVQKISELVSSHPSETVAVIRSWMATEG